MTPIATFWETSVGKKAVMAVTGLILVAYLITHVLANLLVFTGPDRINRYAAMLHATGGALWAARLVLLVAVILHIVAATQLALRRQAARPVAYAGGRQPQVSTLASRTIRWGGALLLVFIIFPTSWSSIPTTTSRRGSGTRWSRCSIWSPWRRWASISITACGAAGAVWA